MKNLFTPRVSFIFTIIAATVFYYGVEVADWHEALAIFVIWTCGIIAGLLDAELINDSKSN